MKLAMQGARLRPLLENAAALAPGLHKRPALESTRLSVRDDGSVVIAASNTRESIQLKAIAHKYDPGEVFLPSENLLRLVKEAKEQLVTITWNGKSLKAKVRWGRSTATLPTEAPGSLPEIKTFDEKRGYVTMKGTTFTEVMKRTAFAVQTDFTQRAMHGVSVEIREGNLTTAATDGMRFSLVEAAGLAGSDPKFSLTALVPPLKPKLLSAFVGEGDIDLQVSGSFLHARGERGEMAWTMLQGEFPDWRGHVPKTAPRGMTLDRKTMLSMLKQAGLLKVTGSTTHRFTLDADKMLMETSAGVEGGVAASIEIPWPHAKLEIGLDPKFMEEGLAAMGNEKVWVGFDSDRTPVVMREDHEDFDYIYCVVPRLS